MTDRDLATILAMFYLVLLMTPQRHLVLVALWLALGAFTATLALAVLAFGWLVGAYP